MAEEKGGKGGEGSKGREGGDGRREGRVKDTHDEERKEGDAEQDDRVEMVQWDCCHYDIIL